MTKAFQQPKRLTVKLVGLQVIKGLGKVGGVWGIAKSKVFSHKSEVIFSFFLT